MSKQNQYTIHRTKEREEINCMEGIIYRSNSLSSQTKRGESTPSFNNNLYISDYFHYDYMTGETDDLIVPTILSSSLIIAFKEICFELKMKKIAEGEFFISTGLLFQHPAP